MTMRGAWMVRGLCGVSVMLGVMAGGCASGPIAPSAGFADPVPSDQYPKVAVEDSLSPWLAIADPVVVNEAGKPLKVSVPVRLTYDKAPVNAQYRFIWLDSSKVPLRVQGNWQFVVLPPTRTQVFLVGNAVDTSATDWRLEVRVAR